MKIIAETERLILRELLFEDEKGLFELDADPEVHRYLGNNPVDSMEQVRNIIKFIRQQYIDNGVGRLAIIEKKNNNFIGWSGLKFIKEPTNNHVNYYDLGYRLIKKYWGKGFATEAAKASLAYGFIHLNVPEIYAMADVENTSSTGVLEKVGLKFIETFNHDGEKHKWYKLNRSDWMKQQP